ncbi:MAG: ethanolamine ammonia lyase-activating protein, partial [Rhodospirillaceae bacterium]|nr:ethanolamine ammonia lyase-activating protein [Rhodospirillaceae bacterium]
WISSRIGGDQIDYADESEGVRSLFTEALNQHDLEHDMDQFYEAEIPDLPPKPASAE